MVIFAYWTNLITSSRVKVKVRIRNNLFKAIAHFQRNRKVSKHNGNANITIRSYLAYYELEFSVSFRLLIFKHLK
jgi:hypothetical protein